MRRASGFRMAIAALLVLGAAPTPASGDAPGARGEAIVSEGEARVAAELLVDAASVAPGDRVRVGVRFDLDPDWHIYWKNPGDAGAATELHWSAPQTEIGPIQWPAPRVFGEANGLLTTYGYEDEVLLASDAVVPAGAAQSWALGVDAQFVACRIECIPGRIRLARMVPIAATGEPPQDAVREAFDRATSRLPRSPESLGVIVAARAARGSAAAGEDVALVLEILSCNDGRTSCRPWTLDARDTREAFVPTVVSDLGLSALGLSHPPSGASESARGLALVLEAHAYEDAPELAGQRLGGVVPLTRAGQRAHLAVDVAIAHRADGASSRDYEVVAALPAPTRVDERREGAAPGVAGAPTLGVALVLGLIGGLILNLMPCVLPVLAIKIFAITDLARAERGHVVKHGFAYLAGVLASMAVLAAAVVALRAAGTAVGWGFQLQDPVFLAFVCTVLVVFALNLFGAFEITLQPAGPDLGHAVGPASPARSFFEGTLAVVLATPCTAPFLGTAVGFAFAGSGLVIFAVFTAIGVGLAAPYLLVTLVPGWARFVPRPGAWMLRVRQGLGFSLLATVAWLSWVAGRAVGVDAQALLLTHLLAVAFLVWVFGAAQAASRVVVARVVAAITLALVVASLSFMPLSPAARDATAQRRNAPDGIDWRAFDRAAIDRERAAGRPVFVDFTADWCITCKVNETVVLSNRAVRDELARWNFAAFKADWTLRDDEISRALAEWGRAGVPLYLVYPPGAGEEPQLLPELLTLETTVEALRAAGSTPGA